jgi:hypothetical protein
MTAIARRNFCDVPQFVERMAHGPATDRQSAVARHNRLIF